MSEQKENQGRTLPQQGPTPQQDTVPQEEPTNRWEPAQRPQPALQGEPAPKGGPAPKTGKLPAGKGKKKPKYTGKARAAYIGYVTLTVVSALIVAFYIAFSVLSSPPPTPDYTRPPIPTDVGGGGGDQPIFVPGISSERKEEFYTFLLVGQSEETGGSLTDTMMLASYDVPNQALSVMSLPRDTYVNYNGRNRLLNNIYTLGGINDLRGEVRKLTGIYPDYYVIVQWEAFGELVDAIDGVYYDVPRDMQYYDPTQNLRINLKKGYQLLNGDKAMQVVRFREGANGYADGDLGRIRTQQGFMKALVKKCLEPATLLSNLGDYISIFQRNVETNLDLNALTYFVKSAVGKLEMEDVEFVTLPIKEAGDGAHLLALPQQVLDLVNERFNPYLEALELGELSIVTSIPLPATTPKPTESAEPSTEPTEDPTEDPEETTPAPETSEEPGDAPYVPPETSDQPTPPPTETDPAETAEPSTEPTPPAGEEGPMIPGQS